MKFKKQLSLMLDVVPMLLTKSGMKLLPNAVDTNEYLNADKTPSNVYQVNADGIFYDPFNFSHDDFGRLIIIRIDDHPEIKTVELIVQDGNKGALVVIYYTNGKVENYLNPSFSSDKAYVKLDKDWKIIEKQDFEYVFEDTPTGVSFALDIKIKNDHRIKINLKENRKEVNRHSILATIGSELQAVKRFPLIYMRDAGLIPIEGTEASFEIDGEKMELSKTPINVEGQKRFESVYCFTRLPFFWNDEQDVYLSPVKLDDTQTLEKGNAAYSFFDNNGHNEIQSIIYKVNGHSASFRFSPSFPDLASLKTGSKISGRFCLGVDEIDGVVGGKYSVLHTNGEISIDLRPEKCWGSVGKKDWVFAYHYHAKLKPETDNKLSMQSEWTVD